MADEECSDPECRESHDVYKGKRYHDSGARRAGWPTSDTIAEGLRQSGMEPPEVPPSHNPLVHVIDCPACKLLIKDGLWSTATYEHAHSGEGFDWDNAEPVA